MATVRTRGDSLALYLTGAASAGDSLAVDDQSLGGYRSSVRAGGRSFLLSTAVRGLTIDYVSGANPLGTGSLQVVDADSLGWTPPGGGRGDAVAIAEGEQKVIEGADPSQFAIVTRTSDQDLSGSAAFELLTVYNDVVGQADGAALGDVTYRCLCLKNGGAQTVRDLAIWLGEVTNVTRIALERPASQPDGPFQTIADERTAPTGVSFVAPTSQSDPAAIKVYRLAPDEQVGVWLERDLSAAAAASAKARLGIRWAYAAVG